MGITYTFSVDELENLTKDIIKEVCDSVNKAIIRIGNDEVGIEEWNEIFKEEGLKRDIILALGFRRLKDLRKLSLRVI